MEPVDFIMPGQRKPNLASIRCIIGGLSLSLPPQPHAISVTLVFILQGIRLAKESSKNVSSLPPLSQFLSLYSSLSLSLSLCLSVCLSVCYSLSVIQIGRAHV